MTKRLLLAAAGLLLETVLGGEARAEPAPREVPTAGSVISTRVGEEIEFVEAPSWRGLETLQDVKAGDVVRTNALGQVAILFADQTQLRLGRNATLLVRALTPGGATRLELTQGRLFGRTPRGGTEVRVETPAATAAIRGTDWSMSVEGERSSLLVLDGAVEFTNPQGSVTVQAGEAATATLGQAPSKVLVVSTDLREQMLINLSLRGAFEAFSPYALSGPSLRAAQARIETIPPDRRTAEDRVIAAELALDQAGREAALEAVAAARQVPLTRAQAARLTLIEAIVAGAEARYAEAARLFDQALPGLRGEQAAAARYQAYFARSLADPTRALPPPSGAGTDRISVVGQAITAAFLDSPDAAYAILARAAPRFPDDPVFLASLAEAAMLVGDYEAAERAVDRAAALAPDDPEVLSARAGVRAAVRRDLEGALADLERALAITPASADLWNDLGLLQSERGADREAERAFLRAIELDPEDPVTRANYAILLLDADRLREADAQIEAAFAADPSFEFGHFARGRQRLQSGDQPGAVESLLRATTANPAFSQGLLLLGAAYAEGGDFTLADQALANAGRLDPNDPIVSQFRASLATFLYQADDAIRFAQDSVRQTRARGGAYASIAATRDFGSTLGGAYRALSLGAWGDYWSDVVFDPFDSGGYFDRAITGGPSPLLTARERQLPGPDPVLNQRSFSDLLQGLLLDPMALVGPSLRPAFVRAPFTELDLGGGPVRSEGDAGYNATGTFQKLGTTPVPYSLLVSGTYDALDPSYGDQDESSFTGLLGFGLQPTPNDRLVAFVNGARERGGVAFAGYDPSRTNRAQAEALSGFVGWSHTFGHRNVLNAAISSTRIEQDNSLYSGVYSEFFGYPAELGVSGDETTLKVGLAQMLGRGPLTLRFGAEAGEVRNDAELDLTVDFGPAGPLRETLGASETTRNLGRVWIDALAEVGDRLRVEAALFGTYLEDDPDETLLAPRLGFAFTPVEGHWLRAGVLRERPTLETSTLAPIGLLGLDSVDLPQGTGQVDTALARWDAEWTPRFFTALEYQHQEIEDLSISFATSLEPLTAPEASLDRLQLSANLWITGGIGVFGTVARNWSEAELITGDGDIPFVPDVSARFGVTHVSPRLFTVTLAETYLGERASDEPGQELAGAWTTDLTGSWESPSRRISLDLGVYNLFDATYEIAPGLRGVGRTLTATLQARF
jgi:Flp pilus assembly protein TadD